MTDHVNWTSCKISAPITFNSEIFYLIFIVLAELLYYFYFWNAQVLIKYFQSCEVVIFLILSMIYARITMYIVRIYI